MPRPPTNGYRKPRVQVIPYTHAPVTEQHDAPDVFIGGVILDSPANAAETTDRTPLLAWFAVNNATEYQVQADEDVAFGSPEIDELVNTISYAPSGDLAYEEYNWRVRVTQPFLSKWSAVRTFTVAPIAPTITAPTEMQFLNAAQLVLEWGAVNGADTYEVQIALDSGFSIIVESDDAVATTSFDLSGLDPTDGQHFARVRVKTPVESEWSATRSFYLHTYPSYALELVTAYGGGDWPLNDADSSLNRVADNRAISEVAGSNVIINSALTGNPLSNWQVVVVGDGVVTPQEPGVRIIGGTTGGSSGIFQGSLQRGKTYEITAVITANAGGTGCRVKTGTAANDLTIPAGTTGTWTVRLIGDNNTNLQLISNTNNDATWESIEAVPVSDLDCVLFATRGVTGEGGVTGAAYDFAGTTQMLYLPNQTTWNGLTDLTIGCVLNPDVFGTGDRLVFKSGEYDITFNSDGTVSATFNYSISNATCTTSTPFSTGSWQGFAVGISDSDKLPRIYRNGVECAYSSQTAGVGTRASNTNDIRFFSNGTNDASFNGKAQKLYLLKTAPDADLIKNLYDLRNVG